MPTIGEETYDDTDRVPTRDVRGTAEQARYGSPLYLATSPLIPLCISLDLPSRTRSDAT